MPTPSDRQRVVTVRRVRAGAGQLTRETSDTPPRRYRWPDPVDDDWVAADSRQLHRRLLAAVDAQDGDAALKAAALIAIEWHAPQDGSRSEPWARCYSCLSGTVHPAHPCPPYIDLCEALDVPPWPSSVDGGLGTD